MKRPICAIIPLVVLVIGCGHKETSPSTPVSAPVTPTAATAQIPAATPPSPSTTPPTEKPNVASNEAAAGQPVTPKADTIPQSLKSAAYEYYGLGNSKPIDYDLTGDDSAGVRTGSQTTTIKEVKDGKASFVQTRTGGLALLGNDELLLDSEGVHVTSSTVETVDPQNLEFPSDVSTGKSWTSHDKITQTGLAFDINTRWTIKGIKPIETKRGTLDALLITSTGEGTENGQKLRMESETYYVKGIGLVKAIIKTTSGTGKHSSITQQLAN